MAAIVSTTNAAATFGSSRSVTIPATTAGNSVIFQTTVGSSGLPVVGCTLGGAAMTLERIENDRTGDTRWVVFALHNIAAGATTVTITTTAATNLNEAVASEVSGLSGADASAYARLDITAPDGLHDYTSTTDGEFIVALLAHSSSAAITVPSGWTSYAASPQFAYLQHRITGPAGAQGFGNSGTATVNSVGSAHAFAADAATTAVGSDRSGAYAIANASGSNQSGAYAVLAAVDSDRTGAYAVLAAVGAEQPGSYAVLAAVGSNQAGAYAVAAAVGADRSGAYGVLAAVGSDRSGAYSVESAMNPTEPVGYDRSGAYAVLAAVGASRSGSYAILGDEVLLDVSVITVRAAADELRATVRDDGMLASARLNELAMTVNVSDAQAG